MAAFQQQLQELRQQLAATSEQLHQALEERDSLSQVQTGTSSSSARMGSI
jgi:hypothetical protein